MKKDQDVLIFSLLYVLIFTFTYIFIYYDLYAFLFLLIIICSYSFPSLFSVLILLFIERQFKFNIHNIFYLILSMVVFYISFILWNSDGYDNRNIYPTLSSEIHIIVYYAILSHTLAYFSLFIFKYLKKKINAT